MHTYYATMAKQISKDRQKYHSVPSESKRYKITVRRTAKLESRIPTLDDTVREIYEEYDNLRRLLSMINKFEYDAQAGLALIPTHLADVEQKTLPSLP